MSTIAAIQAAIGYHRAQERDGCAKCAHAVYDHQAAASGQKYHLWRCELHGFGTAPLAICRDYTPRECDDRAARDDACWREA